MFFQVWSPCPPHEETHLNISQLGTDVIWAKCCEMKVELKLQHATLQEKRTCSRVILCTETTLSHCHAPSYTSIRTLVLYALPQLDGRRCRRGNGIEVKSMRRNNCLHSTSSLLDLFPVFANGNQRKLRQLPCRWTAVGGAYLTCFSVQLNRRICRLEVAYL